MQEQTNLDITEAITRLGSRKSRERAQAERQLCRLGAAAVEPVLAAMQRERAKRCVRMKLIGSLGLVTICGSLGVLGYWVLVSLRQGHWDRFPETLRMAIYFFFSLGMLSRPSRRQKGAARILAQCDNVTAVAPLVEALAYMKEGDRREVVRALTRLLPRVQASDASLFTRSQKATLYYALKTSHWLDTDFLEAGFKALEQIGDKEAIPYVQAYANLTATSAKGKRVRDAARQCLVFLQERAAHEQSRETLLRPAVASYVPSHTLLRAAEVGNETDPRQLLRADTKE